MKTDIKLVTEFEIPRNILMNTDLYSQEVKYSLLCFCDASSRAYAAAIYFHQYCNGSTKCDLIFAKARLAPVKTLSIPRLELHAVLIGVRCLKFVKGELKLPVSGTYLWTDSQCILKWISTSKDLTVFVKNRIAEIRSDAETEFKYVPSKQNPADIATRGVSVENLRIDNLWWHGPEWLMESESEWNKEQSIHDNSTEKVKFKSELKKTQFQESKESPLLVTMDNCSDDTSCEPPFGMDIFRFSSFTKLLRVTALVNRFISKLKKTNAYTGDLSSNELYEVEKLWILFVQRKFLVESRQTKNFQRQLGTFSDNCGVIRCKGRLENAGITEGAKYPILLNGKERFTHLLVDKIHNANFHCGVSQTIVHIRQRFWIPKINATVKYVIHRCLVCRRYEGGPYKMPPMAPIPELRVSQTTPFMHSGLDYFGPVYIKYSGETSKRWVCLFTCLVTRAIHLEVIQDMTAMEFLYAFRRFIATRGTPCVIISDNASQFKCSSSVLKSVWRNVISNRDVLSYSANKGITWKFITELAPWMGGFYERLVGVVKKSFRKMLGRKLVTDIQLQTLLKEIEAIVNSRPLVHVGEDLDSNITLTPRHFLTLNPDIGIPNLSDERHDQDYEPVESSTSKLLKIWKKGQYLLDSFWKSWKNEYLLSLRERTQTRLKCGRILSKSDSKVGDIVIVKDDIPRGLWKLGKIVELIISQDGNIRSAKVKLASGRVIGRPINLLCPLEVQCNVENDTISKIPGSNQTSEKRPLRRAAVAAYQKLKQMSCVP